jgi:hypothetical protein
MRTQRDQIGENSPRDQFFEQYRGTLPEIVGEKDLKVLNSALGFLFAGLREARQQFDQTGEGDRQGPFTALGALWKFAALFKRPDAERLNAPTINLMNALVALDENRVLPVVNPSPRRGRSPSDHGYQSLTAHAVRAVERLVHFGVKQQAARVQVAKLLHKLGVRAERGRDQVTATTLKTWSNKISTDVGRYSSAAKIYDHELDSEGETFLKLPKAEGRRISLQKLSAWVQSTFPQGKLAKPPI